MSKYSELFQRLDSSGNGTISKTELMQGLAELNITVEESKVDSFFAMVDVDGDGEISEAEFTAFVSTHNPDNSEFMGVFNIMNQSLPGLKKLSKFPGKSGIDRKVFIIVCIKKRLKLALEHSAKMLGSLVNFQQDSEFVLVWMKPSTNVY
jgi:hypothetical protein